MNKLTNNLSVQIYTYTKSSYNESVNIRLRTVFFVLLSLIFIWFLFAASAILTPFILAAIFAYIFNPVVTFFSEKIKLPRTVSVLIIYVLILSGMIFISTILTSQVLSESTDFRAFIDNVLDNMNKQVFLLPEWLRPAAYELLNSAKTTKLFSPQYIILLFPQAISRIVSFLIFLFSAFYFLREGRSMFDKMLHFIPKQYKLDVEILLQKINSVLNAYLRGQIFLIFFVSAVLFIALQIMGIRFSLIVAIFSGFAEIIPIVGPIVAAAVAVVVVLATGATSFGFNTVATAVMVIIIYFIVRQFEDYFIMPNLMGKITKLHPLVILLAALAGEHLGGIMGLILAVPIAAAFRVLLDFSLDKINEQELIEVSEEPDPQI